MVLVDRAVAWPCEKENRPLLADPSFFTVLDTYGIELIHPRREGRSKRQIGRKDKSNGRSLVGVTLAWLINDAGEAVDRLSCCLPAVHVSPSVPIALRGSTTTSAR